MNQNSHGTHGSDDGIHDFKPMKPDPELTREKPLVYVYLLGQKGQILQGHFERNKLPKLVEHFLDCESMSVVESNTSGGYTLECGK